MSNNRVIPALILLSGKSQEYNKILTAMKDPADIVTAAFDNMRNTLGQQWKMLETRVQNIAIIIGLQLIPVLSKFLTSLMGGVGNVMAFVQSSGGFAQVASAVKGLAIIISAMLLPAVIGIVTASLPFLATLAGLIAASILVGKAFDALTQHFGSIQNFMRDTSPLALALKAALITLAIVVAVEVVGALYSMATAAWAAGVAMIAATWPILLLVAIIALLVFAGLELVTHWKQISTFLLSIWTNIQVTAKNIWGAIVGYFTQQWALLVADVQLVWTTITGWLHAAWNRIVGLAMGFAHGVVNALLWLYNHNVYVKWLVDAIIGFFVTARQMAIQIWTAITTWLVSTWKTIQQDAQAAWLIVLQYVVTPIQQAYAKVMAVVWLIVAILRTGWNTVATDVKQAWDKFVAVIVGVYTAVKTAVQKNIVDPITTIISTLITTAETWGKNLISSFIKGIQGMAGQVGDAAKNIAGKIGNFLGFHSPAKEGPGSTADTWAPSLMRMFTGGILAAIPALHSAANAAGLALAGGLGGARYNGIGASSVAALGAGLGGGGGATITHNWAGAFPNAVNQQQIVAAIKQVQRDQYNTARVPGFGGGLRTGIQR